MLTRFKIGDAEVVLLVDIPELTNFIAAHEMCITPALSALKS